MKELKHIKPESVKTVEDLNNWLETLGSEGTSFFTNPDFVSAIMGLTEDECLLYNYDKMIEHLVETDDMSVEDAEDFICYNTLRTIPYMGEKSPIVDFDEDYK